MIIFFFQNQQTFKSVHIYLLIHHLFIADITRTGISDYNSPFFELMKQSSQYNE